MSTQNSTAVNAGTVMLVSALVRKSQRRLREEALALHPDLTSTGHAILRLLAAQWSLTPGQIGDVLTASKSIVGRQPAFPRRHEDRRSLHVRLDTLGRQALTAAAGSGWAVLRERLAGWGEDELDGFARRLSRLLELLQTAGATASADDCRKER